MVLELLELLAALRGRSAGYHPRAGAEVRLRVRDAPPARRGVGHTRLVLGGVRGRGRGRGRGKVRLGLGLGLGLATPNLESRCCGDSKALVSPTSRMRTCSAVGLGLGLELANPNRNPYPTPNLWKSFSWMRKVS